MSNIECFIDSSTRAAHLRKKLDNGVRIDVTIPSDLINSELYPWEDLLKSWLSVIDQATSQFVENTARLCHEANRVLQLSAVDPEPSPPWDQASEWQKESSREGVRKALQGETPEQLHESWLEFKLRDGWVYGDIKDEHKKTHPCMVRYEDLPEDQQIKDEMFHTIVQTQLKNVMNSPTKDVI